MQGGPGIADQPSFEQVELAWTNICCLTSVRGVICPSVWPFDRVGAAAALSLMRPPAKDAGRLRAEPSHGKSAFLALLRACAVATAYNRRPASIMQSPARDWIGRTATRWTIMSSVTERNTSGVTG